MTAGLLTIMGSGETSPTMVSTHRRVLAAAPPGPVVLLDTPYGFQENAAEITSRAVGYFASRVGVRVEPLSLRSLRAAGPAGTARFEAGLRAAGFAFSGPGSPTYAVEQWGPLRVGEILASRLREGAAVTFASAAAVTLGSRALPVYEIYKAGAAPYWADGLDVLGAFGIDAVVIPHFDNAEGGTHDTRFCYMGLRRLEALEAMLPEGTVVIGVDEHTACVIDLGAAEVRLSGKGSLTVRFDGMETVVPAGSVAPLSVLSGEGGEPAAPRAGAVAAAAPDASGLLPAVEEAGTDFASALANGDGDGAATAIVTLEQVIADWAADTLESDAVDRARRMLRTMVVRLGAAATRGLVDPRVRLGPYVEALIETRSALRARGDWEGADAVRDRLTALGVEVRDGPGGPEWLLGGE